MSTYNERALLLSAAARCLASEQYFNAAQPGPNDDAEMELNDDQLEAAARAYVAAADGHKAEHGDPLLTFVRSVASLDGDDAGAIERRRRVSLMSIVTQAQAAMDARRQQNGGEGG
jgi:hypothetical protein